MPYTAQFFAEKLNVPVEYFNPLRNVQIDPAINLEDLARVAHSMGELVGLGLRNMAQCPVELNLMPESTLKWQSFNQKKPYLIASVFSLVLVVAAVGLLFDKLASAKNDALQTVHQQVEPAKMKAAQFDRALSDLKNTQKDTDQIVALMEQRYYWADVMSELRNVLAKVEGGMKNRLRIDGAGIWVENFTTADPRSDAELAAAIPVDASASAPAAAPAPAQVSAEEAAAAAAAEAAFRRRYGMSSRGSRAPAAAAQPDAVATSSDAPGTPAKRKPKTDPNEINTIRVTFRAVNLSYASSEANKEVVYSVLNELKSSPIFDPEYTDPDGRGISQVEEPGTFTFGISVALKRPFKL